MNSKIEQKKIDSNLKLIVKSSFIIFIGLFLSKIFTYLYRIIIARNFGPEVYGLFSIAIMILGWFVLFGSLGFSEGLIRYLSWYRGKKDYKRIKYLFNITILINLFIGIISAIILYSFSEFIAINIFHNGDLIIFLKIFSFLIPVYLLSNILLSVLQAFERIQWYSFIVNVLQNIIKLLALIILIFFGIGSNSIIFSYFLGYLAILIFSYFICRHKTPEIFGLYNLKPREKTKTFKEFYSYSWPLLFTVAISEIFFWADSFFIGYFNGAADVGFYNVAVSIVLLLMIVPELFLKLFFPLITKEYSKNNHEIVKQLSQQVGKWIFVLNIPLFLIMFLFPGVIINVLFGSEYLVASNALKILSLGTLVSSSLIWIYNNLLSMAGKTKLLFINLLFASILNIFLNIFLIPKYGITGAAIATTISKILLGIVLFVEVKIYLSIIPFRRKLIRILIIAFLLGIILSYISRSIIINFMSLMLVGIFFILSYSFLILITKSLDKNDFMILKIIKRKILWT